MKRKANVISNKLDQVPKTRKHGYWKVVNSMRKEIAERLDAIIMRWDDEFWAWMNENRKDIPVLAILNLKPWECLAIEAKREEVKNEWWWIKAVWHPVFHIPRAFNEYYTKNWPLKKWMKSLVVVVEKDKDDPKVWNLHAEQLEIPWENSFTMEWMLFHNPDVKGQDFKEILWEEWDSTTDDTTEKSTDNSTDNTEVSNQWLKWLLKKFKK